LCQQPHPFTNNKDFPEQLKGKLGIVPVPQGLHQQPIFPEQLKGKAALAPVTAFLAGATSNSF